MGSVHQSQHNVENETDEVCEHEEVEDNQESDCTGVWELQGKKSKKVKIKYICKGGSKVCGLSIADGDDSVHCDLCEGWYHPKCQGLTIDAFRALSKYDFIWLCMTCKPNFMNVLKMGSRIESRIEATERKILGAIESSSVKSDNSKLLEDRIISMEKAVSVRMKEQQEEIEKSLNAQKEVAENMPKLQSELKKSTQELKKIVEKKEDKELREVNVIIHNIPESKSSDAATRKKYDSDSFQNIVEALLGGDRRMETTKTYRLGKKKEIREGEEQQKPRLMLVGLKTREEVDSLISRRFNLPHVGFSNIYITRDLSPEEREEQKRLREELSKKGKDAYRIFRGKVVPRQ